jgi:hypothetical protein
MFVRRIVICPFESFRDNNTQSTLPPCDEFVNEPAKKLCGPVPNIARPWCANGANCVVGDMDESGVCSGRGQGSYL